MPTVDVVVESVASNSVRARQVSAMFDCPMADKSRREWRFEFPYDVEPWGVGLIVGPSGSGKSTVMREVFGMPKQPSWGATSVIDDFSSEQSVADVAAVCQAVGFNTIPAWLRPKSVLSNGEQFRVELARALLETEGVIVVDEFTSVVDRQVAQIGAHAVQKHVRRTGKQFVAVTCHYDVMEWLQPDWVLDMATRSFTRRSLRRRPQIECVVGRVPYAAWGLFSPFHYLTANLHRAARCFGLWVSGQLVAFAGCLHRPHPKCNDIMGLSRLVTLPDWQGLGLAMVLAEKIGAAYAGIGKRFHTYPAHPSLVRSFDKSTAWSMEKKSGTFSAKQGLGGGGRPCAVFRYAGATMDAASASNLIASGSV